MYGLAIYSLKVGACLALFYLFFKLLLSRETLHRFNRMVVLGTMLLSFALPLCVITVTREYPVPPELFDLLDVPTAVAEADSASEAEPFPWEVLVGCLYLTGVLAMLVATGLSVGRVMRLVRSGRREKLENGFVLVRLPQATTPFSWWRYIVISEADYAGCGREIITHETAHLRLHHSWDLLATDVAGCLQWFNPAMWLLRRELRAIHEYEADEAVLDSGADARQYQLLLIKKAAGGRWYSVANSFNHSKLKNRITMMLQKRSSRWAGAKALFVVPLAGLALGAFAETVYVPVFEDKSKQNSAMEELFAEKSDKQVTIRVQVVDPSGEPMAGVIMQEHGTKRGAITDRSGRASLQIAESSSVDLLMVGYETVNLTYRNDRTTLTGRGMMRTIERSGEEVSMQVQLRSKWTHRQQSQSQIDVRVDKTSDEPLAEKSDKQVTIRVQVVDPSGEPMTGAILQEHGTKRGAMTDRSGRASLQIAESSSVDLLMAGYETVNLTYRNDRTTLIGRGMMRTIIRSEQGVEMQVEMRPETEASAAGQSRIDVRVDKTSEEPIVIRGSDGKPDAKNQPLYLVDGKEVVDGNSIDPARIKSISILKGASAASYVEKYGDKAKNGVALITLKKEGEPDDPSPADRDKVEMDDVVIMYYGKDSDSQDLKEKLAEAKKNSAGFSSEEWKKMLEVKGDVWRAYLQSGEWKKKLEELNGDAAAWRAYLQSGEWKKKLEELKKNLAAIDSYFQSDEWKTREMAMKEANDYFQSDEWKEAQRTLGEGFRFETETANGTKIIVIDGKPATEADLKALDEKRIQSVNINKDKHLDGSLVSTITVTTKDKKRNKADKR